MNVSDPNELLSRPVGNLDDMDDTNNGRERNDHDHPGDSTEQHGANAVQRSDRETTRKTTTSRTKVEVAVSKGKQRHCATDNNNPKVNLLDTTLDKNNLLSKTHGKNNASYKPKPSTAAASTTDQPEMETSKVTASKKTGTDDEQSPDPSSGSSSNNKNSNNNNDRSCWGEWDVPLGRSQEVRDFIGNQRYREFVASYRHQYHQAKRRAEKTCISQTIYQLVTDRGGRFLDKRRRRRRQRQRQPQEQEAQQQQPQQQQQERGNEEQSQQEPPTAASSSKMETKSELCSNDDVSSGEPVPENNDTETLPSSNRHSSRPNEAIYFEEEWYEISQEKALAKISQALRIPPAGVDMVHDSTFAAATIVHPQLQPPVLSANSPNSSFDSSQPNVDGDEKANPNVIRGSFELQQLQLQQYQQHSRWSHPNQPQDYPPQQPHTAASLPNLPPSPQEYNPYVPYQPPPYLAQYPHLEQRQQQQQLEEYHSIPSLSAVQRGRHPSTPLQPSPPSPQPHGLPQQQQQPQQQDRPQIYHLQSTFSTNPFRFSPSRSNVVAAAASMNHPSREIPQPIFRSTSQQEEEQQPLPLLWRDETQQQSMSLLPSLSRALSAAAEEEERNQKLPSGVVVDDSYYSEPSFSPKKLPSRNSSPSQPLFDWQHRHRHHHQHTTHDRNRDMTTTTILDDRTKGTTTQHRAGVDDRRVGGRQTYSDHSGVGIGATPRVRPRRHERPIFDTRNVEQANRWTQRDGDDDSLLGPLPASTATMSPRSLTDDSLLLPSQSSQEQQHQSLVQSPRRGLERYHSEDDIVTQVRRSWQRRGGGEEDDDEQQQQPNWNNSMILRKRMSPSMTDDGDDNTNLWQVMNDPNNNNSFTGFGSRRQRRRDRRYRTTTTTTMERQRVSLTHGEESFNSWRSSSFTFPESAIETHSTPEEETNAWKQQGSHGWETAAAASNCSSQDERQHLSDHDVAALAVVGPSSTEEAYTPQQQQQQPHGPIPANTAVASRPRRSSSHRNSSGHTTTAANDDDDDDEDQQINQLVEELDLEPIPVLVRRSSSSKEQR